MEPLCASVSPQETKEGLERQTGDQDRAVLPNSGITWFREGVVSSVKLCRGGGDG